MADNPDRSSSSLRVVGNDKSADRAAAKSAKIERLTDLHAGQMASIETRYGGRVSDAQESVETLAARWDSIQAEVDRQPRYARAIFYWPLMLALMLFEIPVNRLSFELFFRESPIVSLGVAFLVGVILVTLAHRLGLLFCRFGYHIRKSGWVSSLVQIVLITAIMFALVYGVSVLRQGYLDFETQPQASFSDMLAGTGAVQAAGEMFKAGLGISGWIFFAINMGIIAVGLTASYFAHDPHPDFQAVDIQRKKAEKKLAHIKGQRADAEAIELRRHANQINRASA